MGWIAPVVGIASTLFGASQQKKAASAQQNASQQGIDWVKSVYGDSQGNFSPYMDAGKQGLAALQGNQYEQSPGYQYLKDEMVSGIDASAAARGQLYSGGHSLDLARHVNGLAAQDYGNWWDRQMGLARLGEGAAGTLGSIGTGTMSNMQNGLNGLADAKGQGYGATAGAVTGIGGILANAFGGSNSTSTPQNFGVPGPVAPYSQSSYGQGWNW